MYEIIYSRKFLKAYPKILKSGVLKNKMARVKTVIDCLTEGKVLPLIYRDHMLLGNIYGYCECHILPDLLLFTLWMQRTASLNS